MSEASPELLVEKVKDDGVDRGVDEGQAKAHGLEGMPVVIVERLGGEVPTDDVQVTWQPAHDEDDHKGQDYLVHEDLSTVERDALYCPCRYDHS